MEDRFCRAALALLATLYVKPAYAAPQSVVSTPSPYIGTTATPLSYPAEFYTTFRPQNALDMISRTPGFTLETGGDARGFGANAGNVLINGQRPTVKSGGIEAVLSRIPAVHVERIELIRGADTAEAQGKALVANIVLRADAAGSGNASVELRRPPGEPVTPKIDLSYSKSFGAWQLSGGIVALYEGDPFAGIYENRDATGTLRSTAEEKFETKTHGLTLTGGASRPLGGGTLSINGRLNIERKRYSQILDVRSGSGARDVVDGRNNVDEGEVGIDWARPLAREWTLKIVALGRTGAETASEIAQGGSGTDAFDQRNRTFEAVGRATLGRQGTSWLRPEVGLEIAYNRLTSRLDFVENGVPSPIAGARTRVSELRGEGFLNTTIRLAGKVKLETGLAVEISNIRVDGIPSIERKLNYIKPSATLVWDLSEKTQLRLGVRRSVSQLDFEAFAASANLVDDRPIAGNAALRPEVTTSFTVALDHRFGTAGAITFNLTRDSIAGALTYVPLTSGGEALVNANTVQRWTASVDTTLPLDAILRDARITAAAKTVRSTTIDPITGQIRGTDDDGETLDLAFRHDLPQLRSAYGLSLKLLSAKNTWYVGEVQRDRTRPYVSAYAETTLPANIKATLTVYGITGEREYRDRRFFVPDRAGPFVGSEARERRRGAYVLLLLARQF